MAKKSANNTSKAAAKAAKKAKQEKKTERKENKARDGRDKAERKNYMVSHGGSEVAVSIADVVPLTAQRGGARQRASVIFKQADGYRSRARTHFPLVKVM